MNTKNSRNNTSFLKKLQNIKLVLLNINNYINISLQNHRNKNRTKLAIQPIQISTFLSVLPFLFGFYQFLNQKYPQEKKYLFFSKNIPVLMIPTEKIHWDTYLYFLKNKNKLDFTESQIYWSDKNLLIQSQDSNTNFFDNTSRLISYIEKKNYINTKLKNNWYRFSLEENNSKSIIDFYYQFDEIPRNLQSINEDIFDPNVLKWGDNLFDQTSSKDALLVRKKQSNRRKQNPTVKNSLNFKLSSIPLKSQNFSRTLFGLKTQYNIANSKLVNNSTLDLKLENFIKLEKIFGNEIRKLFSQTGLIPTTLFKKNSKSIFFDQRVNLKSEELQVLQELIRDIDTISLAKPINFMRLMSGYKYPDMTQRELISFLIQKNISNIKNIRIIFPTTYLMPQNSSIEIKSPSKFLIQSSKKSLKDFSTGEIQYEGPTILLNKKTGLDWEIEPKNSDYRSLRNWLEGYFNTKNPLSDSIKSFFGIYESPESVSKISSDTSHSNKYWSKNLPLHRIGIITNNTYSIIPFERSFQVPSFNDIEWKEFIETNRELIDKNLIDYSTIALPIIETRLPKIETDNNFFIYKDTVDFEFQNPFEKEFKDKQFLNDTTKQPKKYLTNLDFLPHIKTFSKGESLENQYSSGIYQKLPGIIGNTRLISFSDLWEPLTFKSWLVISQIGFAFLVFKVLKALADNYGRELLVYLLDLVALLGFLDDDLKQEIEILMGQREKGFRIIKKTTKTFGNIGGIQSLLPEIVEIVWFLRNSGREFSISKTLPRGILLTGPPGTGKTLLVQAIAGEAEVPVVALSGSSLLEPGESGALKLEILFQEARRLAPCIVFIDEMDTLAQKREQVLQNPMGADEILEALSTTAPPYAPNRRDTDNSEQSENFSDMVSSEQDMQKEKLRILMQFLVELDGIQGRDGVVVIGATNRPEILDPAILRPGRFDRVLELGLPGPEKRQEILKLYSENIGIDKNISWKYLIHRTAGYSAADLASIMNQSTLNAILNRTHHTIQTIESGIDRITTIGFEKPIKTDIKTVSTLQLAYYQAGKILISFLLEYHPPTLVSHLWPRRTNIRALQINQNLQKYFFRFARRIELEHRIIGCYAGKAAEILFLQDSGLKLNLSDFGTEDIQFAQNLLNSMVEKWYFYSKKILIQKNSDILSKYNEKEYRDTPEKIPFFNTILEDYEFESMIELTKVDESQSTLDSHKFENSITSHPQNYLSIASWQYKVADEFELATRKFSDWYRLYLPDPQQNERNLEWTPPDEFYHGNQLIENLTDSIKWTNLSSIRIDYEIHCLVLESFNKAFTLLDQHREILDKLAFELLHKEILREPEIDKILEYFTLQKSTSTSIKFQPKSISQDDNDKQITKPIKLISKNWGENSRRIKSRSLDLNLIKDQPK